MSAAINRICFCPRESMRLRVTPVHEAIRANELGLGRAIKARLVLAEKNRRDRRGARLQERLSTASFAENSGRCRWFIRLTIRDMRTNIEREDCESPHSDPRRCETLLAR